MSKSIIFQVLFCYLLFLILSGGVGVDSNNSHILPSSDESDLETKLNRFLSLAQSHDIIIEKRNLIIFTVSRYQTNTSPDILKNNFKLFVSSIAPPFSNTLYQTFYLFMIAEKYYYLDESIPKYDNIAIVEWNETLREINNQLKILFPLKQSLESSNFNYIFLTNDHTRGPLAHRSGDKWIDKYRQLIESYKVMLVSSSFSCDGAPHIDLNGFMIRTKAIPMLRKLLFRYRNSAGFNRLPEKAAVRLTNSILKAGYRISSILYETQKHETFFNDTCLGGYPSKDRPSANPSSWCDLQPVNTIFMSWGDQTFTQRGLICKDTLVTMSKVLTHIQLSEPLINLELPETVYGGPLYDLYREYDLEIWRDVLVEHGVGKELEVHGLEGSKEGKKDFYRDTEKVKDSKVCFLVRTGTLKDLSDSFLARTNFLRTTIYDFIASLQRQTSPDWEALFFLTDPAPVDLKLQQVLQEFHKDHRIKYFHIPKEMRPEFTKVDAGYTPTDYVLNIAKHYKHCRYLSVSNADNVYGSEVVERVLNAPPAEPLTGRPADMILSPLDSRNFGEQDFRLRRIFMNETKYYQERCVGVETMITLNRLIFTIRPYPLAGKIDLAAMFYHRQKFADEFINFGNFTDPRRFPCKGCQDGYLTEHLVRFCGWSYLRLPLDGLKSIVFHGPSPTLCVAGGNVWFDYPKVNKNGCVTYKSIQRLRMKDKKDPAPKMDWNHFDGDPRRICIRLNKSAFTNRTMFL